MSSPKKPRRVGGTSNHGRIPIPEIWHMIVRMCDLDTAFNVCLVVFSTPSLWDVATDVEVYGDLIETHFGAKRIFPPAALCPPASGVPNFRACKGFHPSDEFVEFCETYGERTLFSKVDIRQGDIGRVVDIDGTPLDCLVFPTNYTLRNAGSGAAVAVFRRAGSGLDEYVESLHFQGRESNAVVTPGFNAGVSHLIHCVGPSPHAIGSFALLYQTYLNAFEQARRRKVRCVAVASIATGALGFPLSAATKLAMRAVRDFVKTHRWDAKVVFVCWDVEVTNSMRAAKDDILDEFNDQAFQVLTVV
ncbi:hypothetical protein DYB36_007618 [Aphanomyces astaci]|uniref:Macro domain-containing protein n=1 Tax=Aphanomyces astaci TaxID=112090 RepID=A0A397A7T6_APHAT|nr:hypothetical protein DYB36_007618 [Aphanomyces astaci]